jgi:restriction endonuclease S subunit
MGRDWNSKLFYISNSRIINVGHISYDDGDGLSFFKIVDKREILMKKWLVRINGDTPVITGRHIDFDLKHYWTNHLVSFIVK